MSALHAAGASAGGGNPVQAGYGLSLGDFSGFEGALARVGARLEARPVQATTEAARQLMRPFDHINTEAAKLAAEAHQAQASGAAMTPGEVVMLTVRAQEFMFHCQLTTNIANRTSDGLQQLFKQQS
ncbi:hypothetical protein HHL10_26425 [Azohydromonas sp. G-1-1-14]|uniref:Uncharacterized protein n=2 Tax=Azohydromonas caseinilytica TaxID=2728836 RepID=A0A848FL33_9BURK|nr:hypothetical protein [Azohydromonas caseinilytica]